ncbi:GAF and ANTAR domain-containing protein [Leifsonia sp. AG29]|uniref:GAF and ANTAR domain-containing protein n=1 Tax=Leifsonia sp. AG29 TaxID=2598860 RepID=UPI001E3DAC79|nr:GAF and ANTAR domain-containing protein [Leifsonia sp. AG29]
MGHGSRGDDGGGEGASGAERRAEYWRPFMAALPVSGTSVSTIGELFGTETVAASDSIAARLDELQFDLGEGPCWDAVRLRRPVLEPDLRAAAAASWPAFSPAALDAGVGALFAFPMLIGRLRIGAVDLYSREPLVLDQADTREASRLADEAGRRLLHRALTALGADDLPEDRNPFSRRAVHQATGMVLAQLDVSADDARSVIQAHAYATNRSMMEVSREVLEGRLDFSALDRGEEQDR